MNDKKAAIFDLDGTIADSLDVWSKIDKMFFEKRKMDMPADYQDAVKAMGFPEAARYTKSEYCLKESEEEIIAEWHSLAVDEYANHIELKPGAKEYLHELKRRGVRIGLATASGHELFEPLLKRHGIFQLFDACVTTTEAGRDKKFPDVYLLCAQKLGAAPEHCVVFEDILVAVRSAKSAGMKVAAVYDRHSAADAEKIKKEADYYITDFCRLPWDFAK